MSDYQKVIDDIRFVLESDTIELTDNLRSCAEIYASLCQEVNTRLRRCEEFLKQNLRSEAIHLSEASPNLLELTSILDFPERDQWVSVVELYELTRPPALLVEVASALNSAYAEQEPLKVLMNRHRVLALAHASLPERIGVLRQLVSVDPASVFWEDDLGEMESARFQEVALEIREATRDGDTARLETLQKELNSTDWSRNPPDGLKQEIKKRLAQSRVLNARRELAGIAEELEQAFNGLDFEAGFSLVSRWDKLLPTASLPADDELIVRAEPAVGWIKDQVELQRQDKAYDAAVDQLTRGLDDEELATADLERMGNMVRSFNRGMPELLATRLSNRLSSLHLAARRKQMLQVGSAVALLVVLIGSIGTFSYFGLRTQKVNRLAESVEKLTSEFQFDEAQRLVDANVSNAGIGRWLEVVEQLAKAKTAEQDRLTKYNGKLQLAGESNSPAESNAAIDEATGLARTEEEKLAASQLRQKLQEKAATAQMERDRSFREESLRVTEELKKIDQLIVDDPENPSITESLSRLSKDLKTLQGSKDRVSESLVKQLDLLSSRHEVLEANAQTALKKRKLLMELTGYAGIGQEQADPEKAYEAYLEKLNGYITTFPDDPLARDFVKVVDAKNSLQITRFMAAARTWNELIADKLDDYPQRIRQCDACLQETAPTPLQDLITEYRNLLNARMSRTRPVEEGQESLKSQLGELYSTRTLPKTYIVKMAKPEINYYTLKKMELLGTQDNARVYIEALSYPGGPTDRIATYGFELRSRDVDEAPYVALAADLRRGLEPIDLANWETDIAKLVSIIQKGENVDEYLRVTLILKTLDLGIKGSPVLGEVLKNSSIQTGDSRFSLTTSWMDPRVPETEEGRETAREVLRKIPDLSGINERVIAYHSRLSGQLSEGVEAVGWCEIVPERQPVLHLVGTKVRNGELLAISKNAGGGLIWKKVGSVQSGAAHPERDIQQSGAISGDLLFQKGPWSRPKPQVGQN